MTVIKLMKLVQWKGKKEYLFFLFGLAVVCISLLPYFILGEDIWVFFHDQLDGEVLNYIYQAKYLGKGNEIPELMNGIMKTGMVAPAFLGVLLFRILPPFMAYTSLQILVSLTAYLGMFLLVYKATKQEMGALIAAGLFAYLPMMPVYGISIAGIPLLCVGIWNLIENKKHVLSYILILVYGLGSSFVLVGFGVCLVLFLFGIMLLFQKNNNFKGKKQYFAGFGFLIFLYIITNLSLFAEVFKLGERGGEESHRMEMVQTGITDLWGNFQSVFFGEGIYSPAYARSIFLIAVVFLGCSIYNYKSRKQEIRVQLMFLGSMAAISAVAVLWQTDVILNTLRSKGAFRFFQADRVGWLIPPIWYCLLGYDISMIWKMIRKKEWKLEILKFALAAILGGIVAVTVYSQSFFYHHIRQVIFPDTYSLMTYRQYYGEDIMTQIDQYIGKDKESYRVVSLGMPPAAALYNGFYCLDGYSNNYSLSYKHDFAKIIEGELKKSSDLNAYFTDWGNRCYVLSAESGGSPMISKHSATIYKELSINIETLKSMGAEYLFSAMEIAGAKEKGLNFETYFETQESYYGVYLYSIY